MPAASGFPERLAYRRQIVPILGWGIGIGTGLLLLAGRYDWSPDVQAYSLRGYLSSAYMLVLVVPTTYAVLRAFGWQVRIATGVASAVVVLCTLPYRWLGLDGAYYHLGRPTAWPVTPLGPGAGRLDWLPEALSRPELIPYERAFFLALAATASAVALLWWWRRDMGTKTAGRAAAWLAIYLLILGETWLHLSLRSPYMYLTHFEKPAHHNYWHLVWLFEGGRGAVNADYPIFRDLEELFIGTPHETDTMLIRRSLLFYLSSQFSYFTSPLFVFLVLNTALWWIACVSAHRFACRHWGREIAAYVTILVATGPGFIMYVAQPMSYLAGYASVIILIALFERLVVAPQPGERPRYLLFGVVLGLASMVYDIFPLYAFFVGRTLLGGARLGRTLASLVLSVLVYRGFLELQLHVLGLTMNRVNTQFIGYTYTGAMELLADPRFSKLYWLAIGFLRGYLGHLGNVFFLLPVVLALGGIAVVRERGSAALVALLALPSLLAYAFLYVGGTYLVGNPRFVYVAYPCVYVLAAMCLAHLGHTLARRWPTLGGATPWVTLATIVLLNNIDILGYPQLYYLFYYSRKGHW